MTDWSTINKIMDIMTIYFKTSVQSCEKNNISLRNHDTAIILNRFSTNSLMFVKASHIPMPSNNTSNVFISFYVCDYL